MRRGVPKGEATVRVEHLAIDGSSVSVEADADSTSDIAATGWAIVPSLMQAHPFAVHPAGHSSLMEQTVRADRQDVRFLSEEDYSLKGGSLRILEVELPTATETTKTITVGAWEGRTGCLTTSLRGSARDWLVEVFDTLHFGEDPRGLAIHSPVTAQPRVPEVIKEVPGLGVLNIRPAIPPELDQIPKARGAATRGGELFRLKAGSDALGFVSDSAVVRITPVPRPAAEGVVDFLSPVDLGVAEGLRVEWTPSAPTPRPRLRPSEF